MDTGAASPPRHDRVTAPVQPGWGDPPIACHRRLLRLAKDRRGGRRHEYFLLELAANGRAHTKRLGFRPSTADHAEGGVCECSSGVAKPLTPAGRHELTVMLTGSSFPRPALWWARWRSPLPVLPAPHRDAKADQRDRQWALRRGQVSSSPASAVSSIASADDVDRALHAELALFASVLGAHDANEDVHAGFLGDALLLVSTR